MAAYAALVSLMNVLERVLHPARNWICLDRKQIESLRVKVCSLIDFLECYSNQITKLDIDGLESQMAAASYAAEDIIEFFVRDQIPAKFPDEVEPSFTRFSQDISKVIEEMDQIETKVAGIKEKLSTVIVKDRQPIDSFPAAGSARLAPCAKGTAVGLDDHVLQLMDRLTGQESKLQTVSIVGMGGIGKTTLAQLVYDNRLIVEHFHTRAWVTISQEYTLREVLLCLLHEIVSSANAFTDKMSKKSYMELGELLYKSLFGRSYLIVMDDIWSINIWNEVRIFFPNNSNGSRIMITTRLSDVATGFGSSEPHEMDFLNEDESWNLLCAKVFPQGSWPLELEETGKKIAERCRGLPLAIVVIAGLLAKSKKTREYWKYVDENLSSIINSRNNEECLKILSLSYSHLPVYLKPCFLYMAVFPEDHEIRISRLIKLWVAEGFLKATKAKSSEENAKEYIEDLIDRNLIVVSKRGRATGKVKSCIVHDLLRDFCLREAQRDNFLCVTRADNVDIPHRIESKRRLYFHGSTEQHTHCPQILNALRSMSLARSLVCEFSGISDKLVSSLKLLRVLDVVDEYFPERIVQLVNLWYLAFSRTGRDSNSTFTYFISLLWDLQTLVVSSCESNVLPFEIWDMTQLRHIEFQEAVLPDPPQPTIGTQDSYIMENLQTLSTVKNFRLTEEFFKRVPNLKKMKIKYGNLPHGVEWSYYCLNNLVHLHKLESLTFQIMDWQHNFSARDIAFPRSLKKLTLCGMCLPWEDITIVGSLPNLEGLKLELDAFTGPEWNPNEEFVRLKFLLIQSTYLRYWSADNIHFPSLEHLVVRGTRLVEIPLALAELPMLRLIELDSLPFEDSVIHSTKQILEERGILGYEGLQIYIRSWNGACSWI